MDQYVALDVSSQKTAVCVLNVSGRVLIEADVPSEPAALIAFIQTHAPGAAGWIGKRANVTMAVAFPKGCRAPGRMHGCPQCPCCPVRAPLQIRSQRCARPCRDGADGLVQRGSGQESRGT